MCAHPDRQRQGIGSALVDAGTRALNDAGCPFIVVLGHPEFYPRFGFTPASAHGVTCEWEVQDAAFMMRILDRARMGGVSGVVRYRQEFTSNL
jgi:putative acetyltransferase